MNLQTLALGFMAATAVGGVAWVFLYPQLSGAAKADKRRASVAKSEPVAARQNDRVQRSRREQVEGTLKEVEARQKKAKEMPLAQRIAQAGLDWTKEKFLVISGILGAVGLIATYFLSGSPVGAVGIGFGMGFGLPRWVLGFLKKRREKKFIAALPDAVDVIVRGIKAGLPLHDSIRVVAADAPQPLKGEFMAILDTQAVGMPLGEACARLYERMPLPEANFFGIVVAIQQKSGGNLSEALGNLSRVLRDRKRMAEKIQAMSMEAKASAASIGSLPPIVMFLVYLSTPNYISLLWTEQLGQVMLIGCLVWMSIGILVMKKMINFDF